MLSLIPIESTTPCLELGALRGLGKHTLRKGNRYLAVLAMTPDAERNGVLMMRLPARLAADGPAAERRSQRHEKRPVPHRNVDREDKLLTVRPVSERTRLLTDREAPLASRETPEKTLGGFFDASRGATGTRTLGLLHAMETLYHLSYSPAVGITPAWGLWEPSTEHIPRRKPVAHDAHASSCAGGVTTRRCGRGSGSLVCCAARALDLAARIV